MTIIYKSMHEFEMSLNRTNNRAHVVIVVNELAGTFDVVRNHFDLLVTNKPLHKLCDFMGVQTTPRLNQSDESKIVRSDYITRNIEPNL